MVSENYVIFIGPNSKRIPDEESNMYTNSFWKVPVKAKAGITLWKAIGP